MLSSFVSLHYVYGLISILQIPRW